MVKLLSLISIISLATLCVGTKLVLDDTSLVLAFMIHRHGDRTPVQGSEQYATNVEKVESFIQQYGYGQLTNAGRQTSFRLGQFIRQRYNSVLSPQYNKSEIYIRSTDSTRAKMTVLTAMAAVYPLGHNKWCVSKGCADVNWTPVPYTTVPPLYDFNLASSNCPTLQTEFYADYLGASSRMAKYSPLLQEWSKYVSINLTEEPVEAYFVQDVYKSQLSLGIPLYPELEELMPQINEAAGEAIDILYGGDNARLNSGVLLNEFFTAVDSALSGESGPKVRVYSAHDVNVYSFTSVTRSTPLLGVPPYATLYSLEVRRVEATGQYIVVPIYMNFEKNELTYLNIDGCGDICSLDQFRSLVSDSALNVDDWRTECGFTPDMVIDTTGFD